MPGRSMPSRVLHVDAYRHGARLPLDVARRPAAPCPEKSCPGSAGNDSRAATPSLDADGVALERVHGQPQRREIADAERRGGRIEHLSHHERPLDDGAADRRAQRQTPKTSRPTASSVGGSTPKAAIAARSGADRAACASASADSASCTSRSGTILSAARPRLRSSAASASFTRDVAERYFAAGAAQLRAREFGKHLTRTHGVARVYKQPGDPRGDRHTTSA